MARIIIKRFTSPGQWEKYWRDRLRIHDNVLQILSGTVIVTSAGHMHLAAGWA